MANFKDDPPPFTPKDLFQQYYCLSAASNAVGTRGGTEDDLQFTLNNALTQVVPQLTGGWKISWGPRVFKAAGDKPGAGPDNVWYVSVSDSQKLCCVAVAGTSLDSMTGWCSIDFGVDKLVDFAAWTNGWASGGVTQPTVLSSDPVTGTGYAAYGTCIGVWNVLSNISNRYAAKGQLLGDYLKTVPADYSIIFTGHSMGGAVAPTIALGLVQAGIIPLASTFILPSAGATPGNLALFRDPKQNWVFPPGAANADTPYAVYNVDLYNTLDVVPQAWSNDLLLDRFLPKIDDIYSNAGPKMQQYIQETVLNFSEKAKSSGIFYYPLPGNSFTGSAIPVIRDPVNLANQILLQHTNNYWGYIGIQDWVSWVAKIINSPPGDKKASSTAVPTDKNDVGVTA